jgi:hypothetical protein
LPIKVFYTGTQEDWGLIEDDGSSLVTEYIYYYSEEKPSENGNYWHYVDGVETPWQAGEK